MKKSALFRIILWACVLVVVIATAATLLTRGSGKEVSVGWFGIGGGYHYSDASKYSVGDFSVDAKGIKKIAVEWIAGSVEFSQNDGDEIIVREDSDLDEDYRLRYYIHDGKITIKFRKSGNIFGIFGKNKSKKLDISLPKSLELEDLDIDLVSSRLTVDDLSAADIDIDGVSGNIELKNVISDEISIEVVSGSVNVFGKAGELDIDGVSGSVDVEGEFKKLDIGTVSGSIDADGAFENIDLETVSGSKTLKTSTVPKQIAVESVSGHTDISLPKDTGLTIKSSSVSGSIRRNGEKLEKNSTAQFGDGSVKINIDTVSGSVDIDS